MIASTPSEASTRPTVVLTNVSRDCAMVMSACAYVVWGSVAVVGRRQASELR
jgi:hypothetical protein